MGELKKTENGVGREGEKGKMKKEDIDKGRRGKSENGVEGEGEKGKMSCKGEK